MELTQKDYEERKARVLQGEGSDEDLRLVKHYESQGFELPPTAPTEVKARPSGPELEGSERSSPGTSTRRSAGAAPKSDSGSSSSRPSPARTTEKSSK